jgi:hypothetical protein
MKKRKRRVKKQEKYEQIIMLGIMAFFILGLLLMVADIKNTVAGPTVTKESEIIKQDILKSLDDVEEKLQKVKIMLAEES